MDMRFGHNHQRLMSRMQFTQSKICHKKMAKGALSRTMQRILHLWTADQSWTSQKSWDQSCCHVTYNSLAFVIGRSNSDASMSCMRSHSCHSTKRIWGKDISKHCVMCLHTWKSIQTWEELHLIRKSPEVDESVFCNNANWKEFHGDVKEEINPKAPKPRGNLVNTSAFVDADHAGNVATHHLHTGVILFICNAPIVWHSKWQNMVESATFGSEFVALQTCEELIVALQRKLQKFWCSDWRSNECILWQLRHGQECEHPRVNPAQEAQCNQLPCSARSSSGRNLMSRQRGWTNELGRLTWQRLWLDRSDGICVGACFGELLVWRSDVPWLGHMPVACTHACCLLNWHSQWLIRCNFTSAGGCFLWKLSWLTVMHQLMGTKRIGIWQRHQAWLEGSSCMAEMRGFRQRQFWQTQSFFGSHLQ